MARTVRVSSKRDAGSDDATPDPAPVPAIVDSLTPLS